MSRLIKKTMKGVRSAKKYRRLMRRNQKRFEKNKSKWDWFREKAERCEFETQPRERTN